MSFFPSKTLVASALKTRSRRLAEAAASAKSDVSYPTPSLEGLTPNIYEQALREVNDHITLDESLVEKAKEAYEEVGRYLVTKLHWETNDIEIVPQGSAATQTLIRSPGRKDFDIDAVCKVNINRIEADDPIGFFETIGDALKRRYGKDVNPKNRCWNINFVGHGFYLEFTPSAPLETVSLEQRASMGLAVAFEPSYQATALGVVDNKERGWKPSNPEGFAHWVSDTAQLQLVLRQRLSEEAVAAAGVNPVPDQNVAIHDTLQTAIRLFKRHRDMCVRRNAFQSKYQPISVILVTLVTGIYKGLAKLGHTYEHPIALLTDLAELLPHMIEHRDNDEWWVANPTVEGENFVEKWNMDGGKRKDAFDSWCKLLAADLQRLLKASTPEEARKVAQEVFGTGSDQRDPDDGNMPPKPERQHPVIPVKPSNGLA